LYLNSWVWSDLGEENNKLYQFHRRWGTFFKVASSSCKWKISWRTRWQRGSTDLIWLYSNEEGDKISWLWLQHTPWECVNPGKHQNTPK
jgi:hypothetical protein